MFRILIVLALVFGGCSVSFAQCDGGQCRAPVKKAVKAVSQSVKTVAKSVASVPLNILQRTDPLHRTARVVRRIRPFQRVATVVRGKPVRSFFFGRCR